jgi:hypothetical protein
VRAVYSCTILGVVLSLNATWAQASSNDQDVRASATRAVAILQKGSSGWFRKQSCVSC